MTSRISPEVASRYLALRRRGLSQAQASAEVGISPASGHRLDHNLPAGLQTAADLTRGKSNPPRTFEELSDLGKEALRNFPFFCEAFFCRDVPPWRADAAEKMLEAVLDPEQVFEVLNGPSGAGKSTLWRDVALWLTCGGGTCDPSFGRALRFMVGSGTVEMASRSVDFLRRILESERPFRDPKSKRRAEVSLSDIYGRFKPSSAEGDLGQVWTAAKFTVAQIGGGSVAEKEPSFQAISLRSTYFGDRSDIAIWDDPAKWSDLGDISIEEKFTAEAESRVEPGGTLFLIGQRMGDDLHRAMLDRVFTDENGEERPAYRHIVYPAHNETTCDGDHRQWNAKAATDGGDGCLLDEKRLPWKKCLREMAKPTWGPMYQQEDADPMQGLAQSAWIEGGIDSENFEARGCLDRTRSFWELPPLDTNLIHFVSVDPSGDMGHWSLMHRAYSRTTETRYVINGLCEPMTPERFLDVMERWQTFARNEGRMIWAWVIESNYVSWLKTNERFLTWCQRWPAVKVIWHQTQKNANDLNLGIAATLPPLLREGTLRLPYSGDAEIAYAEHLKGEVLGFPRSRKRDAVIAAWIGEAHLPEIIAHVEQMERPGPSPTIERNLPAYLARQVVVIEEPLSKEEFEKLDWIDQGVYEQQQKEQKRRDAYWHPRRAAV